MKPNSSLDTQTMIRALQLARRGRYWARPNPHVGCVLVREGDSLYRIAGKFKVSVDDIIAWNALDPSAHLKPGQELKLYGKGG